MQYRARIQLLCCIVHFLTTTTSSDHHHRSLITEQRNKALGDHRGKIALMQSLSLFAPSAGARAARIAPSPRRSVQGNRTRLVSPRGMGQDGEMIGDGWIGWIGSEARLASAARLATAAPKTHRTHTPQPQQTPSRKSPSGRRVARHRKACGVGCRQEGRLRRARLPHR